MRLRLSTHDWLGEMQVLVGMALAVCGLIGAVRAISLLGDAPVYAEVPPEVLGSLQPSGGSLRNGVVLDDGAWLSVRVDDPTTQQVVAGELASLPTFVVIVAVLVLLFTMLRTARRSDVFLADMVTRLRIAGLVALVGGCLAVVVEMFARLHLAGTLSDRVMATDFDIVAIGMWALVASAFLAVAEIVRRGHEMRVDLERVI